MTITYQKTMFLVLLLLLGCLQYRLWLEPCGIIDMVRYKKQVVEQTAINEKLKKRNGNLIRQIKNLQLRPENIENRARGELGMIKKDEVFYRFVD